MSGSKPKGPSNCDSLYQFFSKLILCAGEPYKVVVGQFRVLGKKTYKQVVLILAGSILKLCTYNMKSGLHGTEN